MRSEPENNNSLRDKVIQEKVFTAELYSSYIRLIVVVINSVAYLLLMDKANTNQPLSYAIIVGALIYSIYVFITKPYQKYSLLSTSFFTFLSDGFLTAIWIAATGSAESPFYLLWYVSIIAVGQRFSFRDTLMTSVIYAVLYVVILRLDIGPITSAEMFLRVLYIPVIGALAAFFSREFENQVQDKLQARQAEGKAVEAQDKLNALLEELRQIQKELENRVEERTRDLSVLNDELKHEVAEKENVQRAQKQTLESLARINAELESFAYITSHDLKAPLRGIATIAEWLQADYADKLDDSGNEKLNLLKQRVERMNDLIDGILQYSRIGNKNEALETVDVGQVIRESVQLLLVPDHMQIEVTGTYPIIETHRTLIVQVVDNLLSNAYKYADQTKARIVVNGQATSSGWNISVADNGKGIAEAYQEKIFEMFQTLENKSDLQSTGVGLAIVKKAVNGIGGEVWVESEVDKGAKFIFSIPEEIIKEGSHEEAR